jgi:putative hemolysin
MSQGQPIARFVSLALCGFAGCSGPSGPSAPPNAATGTTVGVEAPAETRRKAVAFEKSAREQREPGPEVPE